jgi:two-component sensor histidine kinase
MCDGIAPHIRDVSSRSILGSGSAFVSNAHDKMSDCPTAQVFKRNCLLEEQLLMQELNHRVNNEFTSAIGSLSLAAARSDDCKVKAVLAAATALLQHYADVHKALQMPEHCTPVDAAVYFRRLCRSMSCSKLDSRNIKLVLFDCPFVMPSDRCWRLGMIVCELVSNAARHAFGERGGEIRVELCPMSSFVQCRVLDNGSTPAGSRQGRGLKIIGALVEGLDGTFSQHFGPKGSTSIVVVPM